MAYPVPEEEKQLVQACLQQDRRAQKRLYDKYKDAMYTLAYRITGDFEQAQDVLQEAFVGVFRGLDRFQHRSTLGAWIKSILVRTAYKKIKKEQRHQLSLDDIQEPEAIDWGTSLDVEYLEKAIHSLPPGYRSVFVLIEIEGYAHKEVAELMNISVGTSKSQLFYAKRLLKKKLSQLEVHT